MARQPAGKRPQNLRFAVGELLRYMGRHRLLLFAVAALVTISACANLLGTYMIRPVVNSLAGADISALVRGVAATALIYGAGVLAAWGYTQTMVNMAQKVPVSYTHLDVYKRQALHCAPWAAGCA